LFAIGGAPAASHATLSRAPFTERLLEPLAHARIANDDSLAAIAKPLDIGLVLSTVVGKAASAAPPPAGAIAVEAARGGRRMRSVATPTMGANVGTVAGASIVAPAPRPRHEAADHASDLRGRKRRLPTLAPLMESTHATSPRVANAVAASSAGPSTHLVVPRELSPHARAGSQAPVVVDVPVPHVHRLLAIGTTSASAARERASPRDSASVKARPSRSNDIAKLLTDAVDRARASLQASEVTTSRTAGGAPISIPPRIASRAGDWLSSSAPGREDSVDARAGGTDGEHVGGFRGLAQRTFAPMPDARSAGSPRIEPEMRTPSDLVLDTLDAKVADSLSRVLEREARRHGINVAEARA
jgi:hypothetical protein